jgi:hypothetical protein
MESSFAGGQPEAKRMNFPAPGIYVVLPAAQDAGHFTRKIHEGNHQHFSGLWGSTQRLFFSYRTRGME